MKTLVLAILLAAALPGSAADLPAWMAGTWRSTSGEVQMEEHWTTAEGGLMLGLHRDIKPKRTSFEFMRIEKRGETLVYLAMPGGRPATPFPLAGAEDHRIVFENPEHDFPQRITYWREGEKLCARVDGPAGGAEIAEQWCWTRVTAATEP